MGVSAPAHSAPALFSWLDTTKIGISFAGSGMVFFCQPKPQTCGYLLIGAFTNLLEVL
jgi:hypothetical protein